jgi:hypothetical protein
MIQFEMTSEHPIIFVYDIQNRAMTIPEHVDGQLIDANRSCVSIGTQVSGSGPTKVILATRIFKPEGILAFEGEIETPSRAISVSSSEREGWANLDVINDFAHVCIWANHDTEPSIVTIEAY